MAPLHGTRQAKTDRRVGTGSTVVHGSMYALQLVTNDGDLSMVVGDETGEDDSDDHDGPPVRMTGHVLQRALQRADGHTVQPFPVVPVKRMGEPSLFLAAIRRFVSSSRRCRTGVELSWQR